MTSFWAGKSPTTGPEAVGVGAGEKTVVKSYISITREPIGGQSLNTVGPEGVLTCFHLPGEHVHRHLVPLGGVDGQQVLSTTRPAVQTLTVNVTRVMIDA